MNSSPNDGKIRLTARVDDVEHWKPARKFPEHYPGEAPSGGYLLWNQKVCALEYRHDRGFVVAMGDDRTSLDSVLSRLALPGTEERIPILAYGANRNPATLQIKLRNYGYTPPNGTDFCLPVLQGTLADADVTACGLHGQGYLYGELLLNSEHSRGTVLDVRICLVDADQLRVLNDSEGIRAGHYHLARIPGVRINAGEDPVVTLGYVADAHTWLSPVHHTPIGFSALPALGRRYPAMNATEILDHVLDVLDLRREISKISGLADDETLAPQMAKYLNGQWWYEFHTAQPPISGYERIIDLFRSHMSESQLKVRTFDHLSKLGNAISVEDSYSPESRLTWARMAHVRT